MKQIYVTLKEIQTGAIVKRQLDISNFTIYQDDGCIPTSLERQKKILLNWIKERGEPQHNSKLELISWYIA